MTKFSLFKIVALTLSFIWLSFTNVAIAGICDISGGSGIGGTGSPMYDNGIGGTGQIARGNGSGIGGTGHPIQKKGNGIGGTGQVAFGNGSGIGGTGKPIQKKGNGIGGTGQAILNTGFIVGTITGFGSICVNGIEIHYTSSTPLQLDGQTVNPENSFAIGQVVAVTVSGSGNDVIANDIHILHAVRGPVSMVDVGRGEIEVLGQRVQLPVDSDRNTIKVGDYIDVSGLRGPNGNIIASRIDEVATPSTNVSVRGPISSISARGFDIQGMTVNTPLPSGLAVGQEIHVSGQIDHNGFKADSITLSQDQQLTAEVGGLISIEGYLNSTKSNSTIEISGKVIDIPNSLQEETGRISENQKIIVTGRLIENDVIQMEHILVEDTLDRFDNSSHIQEIKNRHEQDKEDHESELHEPIKTPDHEQSEHGVTEQPEHDGHEQEDTELPEHETREVHEFEAPEHEAPDVHEIEAPEAPEFEAPEAPEFEAPEVPEIEAPEIPEFEAPEVPEFEAPEIPEFEAPEVPEIEVPEIPEFEAPEIPEIEVPEIPEFEAPEIPEIEVPEIPEFEAPEIPEIEVPEVPEFEAPELPEYEAPEIPEIEAPEL